MPGIVKTPIKIPIFSIGTLKCSAIAGKAGGTDVIPKTEANVIRVITKNWKFLFSFCVDILLIPHYRYDD